MSKLDTIRFSRALTRLLGKGSGLALVCMVVVGVPLQAQKQPVRLPGMQVTAAPDPPGPTLFAGVVRDTLGYPIEGVEVMIPKLKRSVISGPNGEFRFIEMPNGKILMRARKFGFAPQNREFEMGRDGGVGEFALVPMPYSMPVLITATKYGGLGGIVADTSYVPIPGVLVHLLDKSFLTMTDSAGTFFIDAPPGSFMLSMQKEGYADRVMAVTIPTDSGRKVSVMMLPPHLVTVREANNLLDLQSRMAWNIKLYNPFYTREDIQKKGITWIVDLVRAAGMDQYTSDCNAIVNGGPSVQSLAELTVDDVEGVEIYGNSRFSKPQSMVSKKIEPISIGAPATGGGGSRGRRPDVAGANATARAPESERVTGNVPVSNTDRAASMNQGKICPVVYVWLR